MYPKQYKGFTIYKNSPSYTVRYYTLSPRGTLKSNTLHGIKKLISSLTPLI